MDSSRYRYDIGYTPTHDTHKFLDELDRKIDNPITTPESVVNDVANQTFGYSLFSKPLELIKSAISFLKREFTNRGTNPEKYPGLQREIAGARKGLEVLNAHAKKPKEKTKIQDTLRNLFEFRRQVEEQRPKTSVELFENRHEIQKAGFRKEKLTPELKKFLENPKFLELFTHLTDLYGIKRFISPKAIATLDKLVQHDKAQHLIDLFKAIKEARKANFKDLDQGKYPRADQVLANEQIINLLAQSNNELLDCVLPIEEGEVPSHETYIPKLELTEEEKNNYWLTNSEYEGLQLIIQDIFTRSTMISLSLHEKGLSLAFSADKGFDKEATQLIANKQKTEKNYQEELARIQGLIKPTENEMNDVFQRQIKRLDKNRDYQSMENTHYLEKAKWEPEIKSDEPITKISRVIGFKIKGERICESRTPLDLSILGNPTLEQRKKVSDFLLICHEAFLNDPEWVNNLDVLPPSVLTALQEIDWLPHLVDQKEVLKNVAKFTFEVNFQAMSDLLALENF